MSAQVLPPDPAQAFQPALSNRAAPVQLPRVALRCEGLAHSFGQRRVLRGVSLGVLAGEVVAVSGPSGSGKSTLLHLLGGLDVPGSGEVWWGGGGVADSGAVRADTLGTQERAAWRARSLGLVFQHHYLLEDLTVAQNLEVPLRLAGSRDWGRIPELLESVGLGGRGGDLPAVLSGGERQRVAIARALVARPAALLADEPTGSLDRANAGAAADLLFALARSQGTGVLLVTHDEALAEQADRRLHLVDGVLGDA